MSIFDATVRSLTMPRRVRRAASRLAGAAMAAGLIAGALGASHAPSALAVTALPPPKLTEVSEVKDGRLFVSWEMVANRVQTAGGARRLVSPDDTWGWRITIYDEGTGERVHSETNGLLPPADFDESSKSRTFGPDVLKHGSLKETRYCVTMQSFVGNGSAAGSAFSAETGRKCAGTQKVLIPAPAEGPSPFEPPAPPPPNKPDLLVTRLTGPKTVFDGAVSEYEVAIWNDGIPAKGTDASVHILVDGPVELLEAVPVNNSSFTCEATDDGTIVCAGALGGVDDAVQTRGAVFKVHVRGNGQGDVNMVAFANDDGRIQEMTMDNNYKTIDFVVQ
jgi:hypothetical protein